MEFFSHMNDAYAGAGEKSAKKPARRKLLPHEESIWRIRHEQDKRWAELTERNLERFAAPQLTTRAWQLRPNRMVEAVVEMKVRREAKLSSRFVTKIMPGQRLHVIETQCTAEGGERVHVVRVGEAEPLGWVTARRTRLSGCILRNVYASEREGERDACTDRSLSVPAVRWPPSRREINRRGSMSDRAREVCNRPVGVDPWTRRLVAPSCLHLACATL